MNLLNTLLFRAARVLAQSKCPLRSACRRAVGASRAALASPHAEEVLIAMGNDEQIGRLRDVAQG